MSSLTSPLWQTRHWARRWETHSIPFSFWEHYRLIHSYLMSNDPWPSYPLCNTPMTVSHFLLICPQCSHIHLAIPPLIYVVALILKTYYSLSPTNQSASLSISFPSSIWWSWNNLQPSPRTSPCHVPHLSCTLDLAIVRYLMFGTHTQTHIWNKHLRPCLKNRIHSMSCW